MLKNILPVAQKSSRFLLTPQCQRGLKDQNFLIGIFSLARSISTQRLNKNLELITDTPRPLERLERISKFAVERSEDGSSEPPLVIIMSWLMAKKRHTMKYAKFYLDQGFHVLCVSTSPLELLFPTFNRGGMRRLYRKLYQVYISLTNVLKWTLLGGLLPSTSGGQNMIAKDILAFMTENPQYSRKILHGFSISGFVWSQVMARMTDDLPKYQPVIDTIVGQVWDSPVDVEGISQGMGTAMFPNNRLLKEITEWYVRFHVNTFHSLATHHYIQGSVFFHNTIVRCPALFFCSEDDPVAFWYICQRAMDRWEQLGVKEKFSCVFVKVWKSSPHVSHMWKYPAEYTQHMKTFLDELHLLKNPDRFKIEAKI